MQKIKIEFDIKSKYIKYFYDLIYRLEKNNIIKNIIIK